MTQDRIAVLSYAVRGAAVLRLCGQLARVLAALTSVPLAVCLLAGDSASAIRYALIALALLVTGAATARIAAPSQLRTNEALAIVALAFVAAALLGAWPLMAAGLRFSDALFEAVSAVTTTGLSTAGSVESRPVTFLFGRAWMQWYGGLGIAVLSVALLIGHHASARLLGRSAHGDEPLETTARTHARQGLIVYTALTVLALAVLWALTGDGFTALLHALAAVSTGGFSPFDDSLAGLGSRPAAVATVAFGVLGAVALHLYWNSLHAGWRAGLRDLLTDAELRALLLLGVLAGATLGTLGWLHDVDAPWYHGFVAGFSAQSTSGFASTPVREMDAASKAVTILSMLVGGSAGSTAGGIKLVRLLIVLRLIQLAVRRVAMPPDAVAQPYLSGRRIDADEATRALVLVLLFAALVLLSWLPFLAAGYDPLDALFEVVSACGTVGLSTGIARPELEPLLKGILCFDMLAGRLEIVALLVVLRPATWFGRRGQTP